MKRMIIVRNQGIMVFLLAALGCGEDAPTYSGPPVASIVLSAPNSDVPVGQTVTLAALVRDVNGDVVTSAPVQWSSSATSIATVTQGGVVTGRALGVARITGRIGTVRDSIEVTIISNAFEVVGVGEIFTPFSLTVPLGTAVRFNLVDEHNVIFANVTGAPADIQIVSNVTVSRTFNTRGTFPYDCTIHPGMSGQIVVQ